MNIYIADDEPKLRRGLARIIETSGHADWQVAGTAADGDTALREIRQLQPDVLFADIKMPGLNGLELIERVRRENEDMVILVISGFAQFEYAQEAIRYGVSEYIVKPLDPQKVTGALQRAEDQIGKRNGAAGAEAGEGVKLVQAAEASMFPLLADIDAANNSYSAVVLKAISYIRDHYGRNIRLDDIAGYAFVHPHYLSELFKKETGHNVSDVLCEYRLMVSRRELRKPGAKIYAVAGKVGFNDPKYFSQVFRKKLGLTPAEYIAHAAGARLPARRKED